MYLSPAAFKSNIIRGMSTSEGKLPEAISAEAAAAAPANISPEKKAAPAAAAVQLKGLTEEDSEEGAEEGAEGEEAEWEEAEGDESAEGKKEEKPATNSAAAATAAAVAATAAAVNHRSFGPSPNQRGFKAQTPLAVLSGQEPLQKKAEAQGIAQAQAQGIAQAQAQGEEEVAQAQGIAQAVSQSIGQVQEQEQSQVKASEMTNYNELEGKKMDEQLINIGGELFTIKYDRKSRSRRRAFFNKEPKNTLTKEEERLLTYLSIVDDTRDAVRTSLYDFFEALPDCQSSAAILSNRKCEVSYYVIWSVLLKARQDVQRKIDDTNRTALNQEKLYQYEARLKSMRSRSIGPIDGKTPCDQNKEQHEEIIRMIKDLQKEITKAKGGRQSGGSQHGGALSFLQRIYASITD